jgi:hypothetical protein
MAPPSKILTIPPPRPPEPGEARPTAAAPLHGSLAVVPPADVVEWLCSNRQTWAVRLFCQGVEGEIVVVDGELMSARWGTLDGLPALSEAVACQGGSFHLVPVPAAIARNLRGPWQALLLQAVQLVDQRSVDGSATTVATAPVVATAEELIDRGFLALRAGNLDEARRCWHAALDLQPGNRCVRFNLRKLDATATRPDGQPSRAR